MLRPLYDDPAPNHTSMSLEYDYELNRVFVNGERMLRGENEHCQ